MVYTVRFFLSLKCSLFHNSNVFGSCFIHIYIQCVLKLKKKFRRQKVKNLACIVIKTRVGEGGKNIYIFHAMNVRERE